MRWRLGLPVARVVAVADGSCVLVYGPGSQVPQPMVDVKPPPMPLHDTPATVPPTPSRTATAPSSTPTPAPVEPLEEPR